MSVAFIGWAGMNKLEATMKVQVQHQVEATLQSAKIGLDIWIETNQDDARIWAKNVQVRTLIAALAEGTERSQTRIDVLQSEELARLRAVLEPVIVEKSHIGFVAFDRSGLQIAALLDEPIGKRALSSRSDFVQRALAGEVMVSLPFIAGVSLPDQNGVMKPDQPTMFSVAPVHDDEGAIIGALGFRLRPYLGFTNVLEAGRIGETGETYAFNADGLMLSGSRFLPHLWQSGLLSSDADTAILNIHIRDPGGNMMKGFHPDVSREAQPLTLMAASALKGERRYNVEGYRDYRGVPVVGAWMWMEDHGFGLASEIDVAEAYSTLYKVRVILYQIFGLLVMATCIGMVLGFRQKRMERLRQKAEAELGEAMLLNQAILDTAAEGIITIDEHGIITSFNHAAGKMFGYSEEDVLERNVSMLMPSPDRDEHDGHLARYLRTGEKRIIGVGREVVGQHRDGTTFPLDLAVSELQLPDRRLFTGIVRDVTERKQAEEEQAKLYKELEHKNIEMEQFTYTVSHDLKSPLITIKGFLGLLEKDVAKQDAGRMKGDIRKIHQAAEKMALLLDELLELSRIGRVVHQSEEIPLGELVQEAVDLVAGQIAERGVQVDILPDLPVIFGDHRRLVQVLQNLIDNAVKFMGAQPDPRIEIGARQQDTETICYVQDNGRGIEPRYHETVFGLFERLNQDVAGTGIGLTQIKRIIEVHGGRIRVESRGQGQGSIFSFTLPRKGL